MSAGITNNDSSEQFYDSLANDYDEMTGMESRFSKEMPIFQLLVKEYNISNALDAACGTGFYSVLLARLGLKITAVDISEQMLQIAKNNAKQKEVKIETIRTSFTDLQKNVKNDYDAVFCLGNSLPHILKKKELDKSLKEFYNVLKSGGRLFIQLLNYNRIMQNRERIQSIKEVNGKIFIRFYDYTEKKLLFNILTIQKREGKMNHSMHSVEIYPWRFADLVSSLQSAGYRNVQLFESMALNLFNELSSKDLVILAQRE